jgi:hypothetical protein
LGIPFLQKLHVGGYLIRQQLAGSQALSAGADARAAVPLQSGLRRAAARSIIPMRSSISAFPSPTRCRRSMSAAHPWSRSPGGEPLLHKELPTIVKGIIARRKFVYLCTNALLMEKRMKDYEPSPYFVWSVHLDGDKQDHDKSVCQAGTYDRAVAAIKVG